MQDSTRLGAPGRPVHQQRLLNINWSYTPEIALIDSDIVTLHVVKASLSSID